MQRPAFLVLIALAACSPVADLDETPEPLGDFRLGHNIALADEVTRGPFSREMDTDRIEATEGRVQEAWEKAVNSLWVDWEQKTR